MDFINTPQRWENQGVKPTDELAKEGFKAGYKPPAAYFNYLFNNYFNCIEEIQKEVGEIKDIVIGGGGEKPIKLISASLPASSWTGEETCTIQIAAQGLTGAADEVVEVFLPHTATHEQKLAWVAAGIISGNNLENALVLESIGEKPEIDIPITIYVDGSASGGGTTACNCVPITKGEINNVVDTQKGRGV